MFVAHDCCCNRALKAKSSFNPSSVAVIVIKQRYHLCEVACTMGSAGQICRAYECKNAFQVGVVMFWGLLPLFIPNMKNESAKHMFAASGYYWTAISIRFQL